MFYLAFDCLYEGTVGRWMESFVADRSQYVAVGVERSETVRLASGVPQGSILGPLLFAMHVSPIGQVVDAFGIQHHQYADDLMLYCALTTSQLDDLSPLVHCSDAISLWFHQNAILLNPGKTGAVLFATRQRLVGVDFSHTIKVAGADFSEAIKLLGVTLDTSLSFDQHVTDVVRA